MVRESWGSTPCITPVCRPPRRAMDEQDWSDLVFSKRPAQRLLHRIFVFARNDTYRNERKKLLATVLLPQRPGPPNTHQTRRATNSEQPTQSNQLRATDSEAGRNVSKHGSWAERETECQNGLERDKIQARKSQELEIPPWTHSPLTR